MKGHLCQSPRTEPTEMKVTQIEIVIPFTGCHLNSCNLLNSISIHSLSVQLRTEPNLKGSKNNKIQILMFCGSYRQNKSVPLDFSADVFTEYFNIKNWSHWL